MKLIQVNKDNERYYSQDFIDGFNLGAKTQYEKGKEAFEKQTPKKPKEVIIQKCKGSSFSLNFICPNCDTAVTCQPYAPNNCKHCGQAIDWGDGKYD